MIIRTEELKDVCSKILFAVDSKETITDMLQLKTVNNELVVSVTNYDYFVEVKLGLDEHESFNATVSANLFLKLISKITTETIEINCTPNNSAVIVKGNGEYKLPIVFNGDAVLELPKININNITKSFDINNDILASIPQYNSKELMVGTIEHPLQNQYYIDQFGCVTFTDGACINNFSLEQPVKLIFSGKLVKLFKLFNTPTVKFTLGYDARQDGVMQTKVRFESDDVTITSILNCDDSQLNIFPAKPLRDRANKMYDYSVTLSKSVLVQAIDRLLLFVNEKSSAEGKLVFKQDEVIIYDPTDVNSEEIYYTCQSNINEDYEAYLDLKELKLIASSCNNQFVTLKFGDNQAFAIPTDNVVYLISESEPIK